MEDPIRPRGFSLPANVIHDTEFAFAVSKFVFDSKQKSFGELVFEFLTGTALLFLHFFLSPFVPPSALWSPNFLRATSSTFRDLFNDRRRGGGGGGGGNKKNVRNMYFPLRRQGREKPIFRV